MQINAPVGFIGLGVMGRPMAENLLKAGYPVVVFNRSAAKMEPLTRAGAKAASSPAEVAEKAWAVITMLSDSAAVDAIYFGDNGIMSRARDGQLFIDMSTVDAATARKIDETARQHGAESLDAPVSGGDRGARAGTLSIMVGGSVQAFERARSVLGVLGERVTLIGPSGAGQIAKACNQMIVGLTIEAVGEAFALAKKAGLDPARVQTALSGGFAQSYILENHGRRALDQNFDPGARLTLHKKDLTIATEMAQSLGVKAPATEIVLDLMRDLVERGDGERDHAYLIEELAHRAGVTVGADGSGR